MCCLLYSPSHGYSSPIANILNIIQIHNDANQHTLPHNATNDSQTPLSEHQRSQSSIVLLLRMHEVQDRKSSTVF